MGPRESKQDVPHTVLVPGSAEDLRELQAALADDDQPVELSADELRRWAENGECPGSLR